MSHGLSALDALTDRILSYNPKARDAKKPRSVELFSGAGGLALGVERAGFQHIALVERDGDACATLRANRPDWPVYETDTRRMDFRQFKGVELLAAGAPCQPFSLGGKHQAHADDRDMFPEVLRVVRETTPEVVVVENVRGLLRKTFRDYFDYILRQLANPAITRKTGETWRQHAARLTVEWGGKGLGYAVDWQLVNCADYGVPQARSRVFIVAYRSDLGVRWRPLSPTHAKARRTVADALKGLPEPTTKGSPDIDNHVLNPGARSYAGHTGSPLDRPAKTLKAGDHGCPGGENMMRKPGGAVRYFTVREAARIQTFPDDYRFSGAWSECLRQIGNAVPVEMGQRVVAEAWKLRCAAR